MKFQIPPIIIYSSVLSQGYFSLNIQNSKNDMLNLVSWTLTLPPYFVSEMPKMQKKKFELYSADCLGYGRILDNSENNP